MNLPPIIGGRYRVLRELGRGGMGAVYLVEHVHTGENLALKVLLSDEQLPPDAIERFKREARAPAKIRSDHVVRVTDADVAPELGGAPFMVMEALDGNDLEAIVRDSGKRSPAEVAWILGQIATALDKAHAIGIVHRDLKPENLFLHTREDGSKIVKILDFGISKVKDGGDMKAAGLTQTGAVMGTPLYMSPEQARGQATSIGPQTDIWALGLVTLRLLTADTYWTADTLGDLLMKIIVDPLVPPSVRYPQLGINLDAWFLRSCERDVSRRFTSVGEQVRAFTAIVNGTSQPGALPAQMSGTMVLGESPAQRGLSGPRSSPHILAHQTGPNALGEQQALAQSGSQPQPFLQTTSGGGLVTATTSGALPAKRSVVPFIVAPLGIAFFACAGFVIVPKLRQGHPTASATVTTEPPPVVSSAPSIPDSPPSTASASEGVAAVPVDPPASAPIKPTVNAPVGKTSHPARANTTPTVTQPTASVPSARPKQRFNPEAP